MCHACDQLSEREMGLHEGNVGPPQHEKKRRIGRENGKERDGEEQAVSLGNWARWE